jgi:uncharacterized membrane protein YfcA
MDFVLYWFMFPVAIVVASLAMLSGIGGAALFTPIFLLVFPLLGPEYPLQSAVAAIGAALLTQTFGFVSGFIGYARRRLIDYRSALPFIAAAMPFAVAGAVLSHHAPPGVLKATYAVLMAALAWVMIRRSPGTVPAPGRADGGPGTAAAERMITANDGRVYRYAAPRQGIGAVMTSFGAFLTGLLSVGIGETVMPQLVRRNRVPVPVAAATSVFIVIATVASASATQVWALIDRGGWDAVPWQLVCYTIPGVLIGGQIGPLLQGRVRQEVMVRAIGCLFAVICIAIGWAALRDLSGG